MSRGQRVAIGGILASGAAILGLALLLQKRPRLLAPPDSRAVLGTRELEPRRWVVSPSDREAYFSDPTRVNREILLRPISGAEPDSITELRIARVAADSPVYAAGFREGDRILRIDDRPVSRLSEAVNLAPRIRAATRLTVDIERAGQELRYRFEFR
jgi:membrane-associated protease RseP (regulator of RpoE activity)